MTCHTLCFHISGSNSARVGSIKEETNNSSLGAGETDVNTSICVLHKFCLFQIPYRCRRMLFA